MRLLSIGDLVEQGAYEFHSRFNRAVNFTNGKDLVSLVDEEIGPGPLSIVFSGLSSEETRNCAAPLRIARNEVAFAHRRFSFTDRERYHSGLALDGWSPNRFHQNLWLFGELLSDTSPPKSLAFLLDPSRVQHFRFGWERAAAGQITRGVHQIFHGDLTTGIRTLKGCGFGLTPSGDDFIAGLLIGLNVLQKMCRQDWRKLLDMIFDTALGNNLFSNTLLDLARKGRLFGRMKDLVSALLREDQSLVRRLTQKLFAVGESSGADLGTGFFLTVRDGTRIAPGVKSLRIERHGPNGSCWTNQEGHLF
jgi:hypothetical protein